MAREDEEYGPGIGGALVIGVIVLLIGMILGVGSLVSKDVDVLTKAPDPEAVEPGTLVYVKGTRSGRTSWRGKEQAWKAGQLDTLILTEAELNQWSDNRLKIKVPPATEDDSGWLDFLDVEVAPVNFRFVDDQLQLATEVVLPGIFPNASYVYQVKGRFQTSADGVQFIPDSGSFGQAPVGIVPFAGDWLFSYIGKQFNQAEEAAWLSDAFVDLESVEITEGQLILRRKTEG